MISQVSFFLRMFHHQKVTPHVYTGTEHNSSNYLHLLVEAMQLSFADTTWYCSDPSKVNVPINELLSKDYAAKRRALIKQGRYVIH